MLKNFGEDINEFHIVFYLAHLGEGGAQKQAAFVMNALIDRGYKASVVLYANVEERVALSSKVSRVFLYDDLVPVSQSLIGKLLRKADSIRRLRSSLLSLSPDCVVSFGPDPLLGPAIKASRYKGKLVSCERGCLSVRNPFIQRLLKTQVLHADRRVFQFDGAMTEYGLKRNSATWVIPNIWPCATGGRNSRQVNRSLIVSAGRLVPEKGFDTLITAVSLLSNNSIKLVIYGSGPERGRLIELSKELGIYDRVELAGSVHNFAEVSMNAGLFVLSSKFEGTPNTLIEAMCAGIPVVATDCAPGGARFLTQNGTVGGLIVPVDDASEMAKAISSLLSNASLAESLGKAGRNLAPYYSEDKLTRKWIALFDELFEEACDC